MFGVRKPPSLYQEATFRLIFFPSKLKRKELGSLIYSEGVSRIDMESPTLKFQDI